MFGVEWFGMCIVAICCTRSWVRDGGVDPRLRIVIHLLSIVAFFSLWIANIVIKLQSGLL